MSTNKPANVEATVTVKLFTGPGGRPGGMVTVVSPHGVPEEKALRLARTLVNRYLARCKPSQS